MKLHNLADPELTSRDAGRIHLKISGIAREIIQPNR